jgi:hypothetical protein
MLIDDWSGPDDSLYKLRADDRNLYFLRRHTSTDTWVIESVQKFQ